MMDKGWVGKPVAATQTIVSLPCGHGVASGKVVAMTTSGAARTGTLHRNKICLHTSFDAQECCDVVRVYSDNEPMSYSNIMNATYERWKPKLIRDSDTKVTVTLPAAAGYGIDPVFPGRLYPGTFYVVDEPYRFRGKTELDRLNERINQVRVQL